MLIEQEYDKENRRFKATTQWMSPEWRSVTTVGVSTHSFAEAIGNMIAQMGASYGSPVVQSLKNAEGQIILQPKF